MHTTWNETENGQTIQKAEAQYVKDPTVIYANVATASNHYKMWIEGKNNYIQMKGTSSSHWFKTKLGKSSSYAVLTDSLDNMLDPFVATSKSFKLNPMATITSSLIKETIRKFGTPSFPILRSLL